MKYLLQALKEDTIATVSGIDADDTSFTLSSGNFTNTTGTQRAVLLVDYDVAAKREYIYCTISSTSVLNVVRGQGGTPATTHAQGAKVQMVFMTLHWDWLANTIQDGWVDALETWTYASATTFTISGTDATTWLNKGDKIRLKQGGGFKYFYITNVAFSTDTTVTITGGTDYTLANAAITDNAYSKQTSPIGFPHWFAYTPTWTASSVNPSLGNGSLSGRFCVVGRTVHAKFTLVGGSTTTFGTGGYTLTLPIATADTTQSVGILRLRDGGTKDYNLLAVAGVNGTGVTFVWDNDNNGWTDASPFTFGDSDTAVMNITYDI